MLSLGRKYVSLKGKFKRETAKTAICEYKQIMGSKCAIVNVCVCVRGHKCVFVDVDMCAELNFTIVLFNQHI